MTWQERAARDRARERARERAEARAHELGRTRAREEAQAGGETFMGRLASRFRSMWAGDKTKELLFGGVPAQQMRLPSCPASLPPSRLHKPRSTRKPGMFFFLGGVGHGGADGRICLWVCGARKQEADSGEQGQDALTAGARRR